MAQARKIGTEYAITSTVQTITIPVGDEGVGQTLINDGTSDIFWREIDPTLTVTGAAATLVATPLFFSRLQPTEYTHQAGITIYAICDTDQQETSTLRVAPGRLNQSGDTDIAALATAVHNEDDAYTAKDAGIPPLAVRKDAAGMPAAAADGDYTPLQTDAAGNLRVINGTSTDVPLAGETAEGATARTGISLWKRAVNKLIDIKALLVKGTAVMTSSLAVTIATNDTQFGPIASASDADGNIHGQLNYIADRLAETTSTGLVYSKVVIEVAAAGYKDLGVGAAGEAVRLHALAVTMEGLGTLQVHSDTDGAGAGESDLSGPITFGAGGGINIPFNADPRSALTSVVIEHMSIESTGDGFNGYAIISKGPA